MMEARHASASRSCIARARRARTAFASAASIAIALVWFGAGIASGQKAVVVTVSDMPNDAGEHIRVDWEIQGAEGRLFACEILRAGTIDGPFEVVGTAPVGFTTFDDQVSENRKPYYYQVRTAGETQVVSSVAGPAEASIQWFHRGKTAVLVMSVVFCALVFSCIHLARRGRKFFIRPISGIEAIDEAIGRATEMGKPILFIPGLFEAGDTPTLAAFSILGRVARKVAEYQTRLIVPCTYSMVMVVAQEVVKQAYLAAGRPESYREQDVFYVTTEQFAYTAAVNGIMLREKPATNFYLGAFFAESLILAETGFQAGSIQIAGTDQPIQIPFFIAACDYTLIGEELYAAAAYLSEEPMQIGTLKAQDLGKLMEIVILILGVVSVTLGSLLHLEWLTFFKDLFEISF